MAQGSEAEALKGTDTGSLRPTGPWLDTPDHNRCAHTECLFRVWRMALPPSRTGVGGSLPLGLWSLWGWSSLLLGRFHKLPSFTRWRSLVVQARRRRGIPWEHWPTSRVLEDRARGPSSIGVHVRVPGAKCPRPLFKTLGVQVWCSAPSKWTLCRGRAGVPGALGIRVMGWKGTAREGGSC